MKIIKLTCALLMIIWVSSANATLIFDFSFTNSTFGGGVVTGEILGLSDNATGGATSVRVLDNEDGFGVGEYVVDSSGYFGNFTVLNGAITDMSFRKFLFGGSFFLDTGDEGYVLSTRPFPVPFDGITLNTDTFVVTQRMSVPEPSTVILLSLGIAGLALSYNKSNKRGHKSKLNGVAHFYSSSRRIL